MYWPHRASLKGVASLLSEVSISRRDVSPVGDVFVVDISNFTSVQCFDMVG